MGKEISFYHRPHKIGLNYVFRKPSSLILSFNCSRFPKCYSVYIKASKIYKSFYERISVPPKCWSGFITFRSGIVTGNRVEYNSGTAVINMVNSTSWIANLRHGPQIENPSSQGGNSIGKVLDSNMALKKLLLDIPFTKKVFKIGTFNNLNSFFKQKIKPNFFLLKRHSADLCVVLNGPHGSSTGGADGSSPSPLFSRGWLITIPHSDSFRATYNCFF